MRRNICCEVSGTPSGCDGLLTAYRRSPLRFDLRLLSRNPAGCQQANRGERCADIGDQFVESRLTPISIAQRSYARARNTRRPRGIDRLAIAAFGESTRRL